MWQELLVGLIVLLAAFFILRLFSRNFIGNASQKPGCSCDCARCCSDKENCSTNADSGHSWPRCHGISLNKTYTS